MFNYYGLKWPSSKSFITSPRHLSHLKAVIFFLGIQLVLSAFVITGSKGTRALSDEVGLLILFMAVLFYLLVLLRNTSKHLSPSLFLRRY